MEDTYPYSHPQTFPTKFFPKNPNPKKPHSHFMYKAIIFAIFVLLLPLFSNQSSETTDQAGNWELIQLIFMGVMVSYVIFSPKNNEAEENHKKFEKLNSYLSNFLQVSSFFDDQGNDQTGFNEINSMRMWKSRYLKRDPLVVLENENSIFENREKPLLLPVRSLKSEVSESDFSKKINKLYMRSGNFRKSISNSGLKPLSMDVTKSINWEFEEICSMEFDSKIQENCFLQSANQSRLEELKSEMENEINRTPPFTLASTLSSESKGNDSIGNRSGRLLKGKRLGRSVRTIRKCEPVSDDFENRGVDEEKGTSLTSEKIFDYRDFEKGKTEELKFGKIESEEFDYKSERDEGRDVDRKADEFIAKFREQIRLSFRR